MKAISCCVLILLVGAGVARAQTVSDLQIELGGYTTSENGGEKPVGVWRSTGPLVIGKTVTSTFSVGETCDSFAVSSDGSLRDNATSAWRIEVTPTRVVRDAVTFRLAWWMAGLRGEGDRVVWDFHMVPGKEVELTLRPGESWPVYTLRNISRHSCPPGMSSIRVLVNTYPWEQDDRRLVSAELWLVERLANGTEAQRSQPLTLRGVPNRPIPFYFDSIVEAGVPLDIFGTVIERLESGAMAVALETRCRWGRPSDRPGHLGPQRSVKSEVQLKPGETVEIRLPTLGADFGPFAKRELSIRIRTRQLR
jgi:hypothetical protein